LKYLEFFWHNFGNRNTRTVVFNMGVATPVGVVCLFLGVARASDKIFIISSIFSISYMEPLFVVA